MIVGNNLVDVYKQIYLLVHLAGFEASYLESITPVELNILLAEHRQFIEESKKAEDESKQQNLHNHTPYEYT